MPRASKRKVESPPVEDVKELPASRKSKASSSVTGTPSKLSKLNISTQSSVASPRSGRVRLLDVATFAPPIGNIVLTCGDEMNGVLGQGFKDSEEEEPRGSKKPRRIDDLLVDVKIVGVAGTGMHSAVLTQEPQVFTTGCNDDGSLGFAVRSALKRAIEQQQLIKQQQQSSDHTEMVDELNTDTLVMDQTATDMNASFKPINFTDKAKTYGNLVQVTAGDSHMAVLTDQGAVLAWGTYRGDSGRIGIRDCFSKNFTFSEMNHTPKLVLEPKNKCVKIASGNDHTLALTSKGEILSWGFAKCGQLGRVKAMHMNSETGDRELNNWLRPHPIKLPRLNGCASRAINVWALGYSSFAMISNAKQETGLVSWGLNAYHQLGIVASGEEHNPGEHVWMPQLAHKFNDIDNAEWTHFAGEQHVIACTNDGRVYGVGLNSDSHLGLGDEEAGSNVPEGDDNYIMNHTQGLDGQPLETKTRARHSLVQIALPNDEKAIGVAAGPKNSYVWTNEGNVYSWGFSPSGALGLGQDEDTATEPTKVNSKHLDGFRVVNCAAGAQHLIVVAAKLQQESDVNNEAHENNAH